MCLVSRHTSYHAGEQLNVPPSGFWHIWPLKRPFSPKFLLADRQLHSTYTLNLWKVIRNILIFFWHHKQRWCFDPADSLPPSHFFRKKHFQQLFFSDKKKLKAHIEKSISRMTTKRFVIDSEGLWLCFNTFLDYFTIAEGDLEFRFVETIAKKHFFWKIASARIPQSPVKDILRQNCFGMVSTKWNPKSPWAMVK